jgi:hypothetical protein
MVISQRIKPTRRETSRPSSFFYGSDHDNGKTDSNESPHSKASTAHPKQQWGAPSRTAEFAAYHQALCEALEPVGALEELLAERFAHPALHDLERLQARRKARPSWLQLRWISQADWISQTDDKRGLEPRQQRNGLRFSSCAAPLPYQAGLKKKGATPAPFICGKFGSTSLIRSAR